MHTGTLRKLALALTFWLALHVSSLKAQILPGPDTSSSATLEFDANGIFYVTGAGTGALDVSGAGTRMFWYPGKAAFRAGTLDSGGPTDWDDTNIGTNSVAFGMDTKASGNDSTAFGLFTTASGRYATAFGHYSTASGTYNATAFGGANLASGTFNATAFGGNTIASGSASTATGGYTTASGYMSFAMGHQNLAYGYASLASGYNTQAYGPYSISSGFTTVAGACSSLVIGQNNWDRNETGGTPNSTSWVATDPAFEIGNGPGSGPTPYTDALVVYKDGSAIFSGPVKVPQSGDIPMYTGN